MMIDPTTPVEETEQVDLAWGSCADGGRTVTVPTAVVHANKRIMCGPCERDWREWIEHQQALVAVRDVRRCIGRT